MSARPAAFQVQYGQVLRRFGLTENGSDPCFTDALALAVYVGRSPCCVISLMVANSEWIVADTGITAEEYDAVLLYCHRTAGGPDILVVDDISVDERFALDMSSSGFLLPSCVGIPLRGERGSIIGSLCVLDRIARTWEMGQRSALLALGNQVAQTLFLKERIEATNIIASPHGAYADNALHETQGKGSCSVSATSKLAALDRSGDWNWWSDLKTPIPDTSGNVIGVAGIAIDISARKQMEEQLQQAQRMEGIGRLAGGIAHDFNNLLTAILGYSDLTLSALPPDASATTFVRNIRKAAERATGLTGQLLSFARKQEMETQVIALNDLIAELEAILRRVIGEHILLEVSLRADHSLIRINQGQFGQAMINLVANARDAMPGGGILTIDTLDVTVDECNPGTCNLAFGPYVLLTITDTGVGMSEAVQKRMYEPFFTTKERGKGTGIGLAACLTIVQQARGHIDVSSTENEGSVFRIYLPTTLDC